MDVMRVSVDHVDLFVPSVGSWPYCGHLDGFCFAVGGAGEVVAVGNSTAVNIMVPSFFWVFALALLPGSWLAGLGMGCFAISL